MKRALISKHVVSVDSDTHTPIPAIILIEDEVIQQVISFDDSVGISSLLEEYADWSPEDYSDYYISPGLIDMNTRLEFENYSSLTQAEVSGGVTLLVEEASLYMKDLSFGSLYCDVGRIATIDKSSALAELKDEGILGFKGYLYPPSSSVKALPSELQPVFAEINALGLPLIIDPNLPNPSKHFLASPLRHEPLEKRFRVEEIPHKASIFAGAYSDEVDLSDQEEENKTEENLLSRRVTLEETPFERTETFPVFKKFEKTTSLDKAYELPKEIKERIKNGLQSSTPLPHPQNIYENLQSRINSQSNSIEILSLAEQSTYHYRQDTSNLEIARSMSQTPTRRPPKIITKMDETTEEDVYHYHLANCPDAWEVEGIKKVVAACFHSPCQVHLCHISSAKSFNKIWKARKKIRDITCEIPASHMYFKGSMVPRGATMFKCHCVIRSDSNHGLLWELLKMKGIDVVTSHHASIDQFYKSCSGKFNCAMNGINCAGFSLQAIWTQLYKENPGMDVLQHYIVRLAKWMSCEPAKILKINQTRGNIQPGKMADLVIWDPFKEVEVSSTFSSNKELCPFAGQKLMGSVHTVFVRGKEAFRNGTFSKVGSKISRS